MAQMKKISILSWNVNGVRAIMNKNFIKWLASANPDILCIQETKAHSEQIPIEIASLKGYNSFWASAEKKGYSGVGIISRFKPRSVSYGIGVEALDFEGRVIIADFGEFLLYAVYFPNGKSRAIRLEYKLNFYDAFLDNIDRKRAEGHNIIFCGDVNTAHTEIDLSHPKENEKSSGFLPIERAWMDKVVEHGYVDTFRLFNPRPDNYIWWDYRTGARERNIGWRLDYFFVNREFVPKIANAYILSEVPGSDHCPVGIDVEINL